MKRDDVIKVDMLKEELTQAFQAFERSLRTVFGELVYGVDTVIERYNDLETKHHGLVTKHSALEERFDILAARVLIIEQTLKDQQ